ncbi:MAG: hypothetical protein V2I37_14350 [Marinilabiliaceae bacterium]|jgi:hypothetical protein|nr:hypothetical protein [Marinilabiliaceae bacterium]
MEDNTGVSNFPDIMNFILGAFIIIVVFSLAYAYLKPHRMHKKYPLSTLLLKISYLVYLFAIMLIIYLASLVKEGLSVEFGNIEFFAFLLVLFVPTIGIFARKLGHFRKNRESYYYFFTLVNVLSVVALVVMYIL